jgi:hypothetical protein
LALAFGVVWHRLVSSSEAFLVVPVERKGSRVDGGCPTRGAGIEVARRMRDALDALMNLLKRCW